MNYNWMVTHLFCFFSFRLSKKTVAVRNRQPVAARKVIDEVVAASQSQLRRRGNCSSRRGEGTRVGGAKCCVSKRTTYLKRILTMDRFKWKKNGESACCDGRCI